jgi:hypothetical protein
VSVYHVQGRCPACGAESLTLDDDHHVTCEAEGCPAPTAVARMLEATR